MMKETWGGGGGGALEICPILSSLHRKGMRQKRRSN